MLSGKTQKELCMKFGWYQVHDERVSVCSLTTIFSTIGSFCYQCYVTFKQIL